MGVVDVRRIVAACVWVLLGAVGCGAPAATPIDVAQAYFRALARDPIRTLPLLTPEFHRRHGLRVATAADARAAAEHRAPAELPAALALDRQQLGWLVVQSRPEVAKIVAAFTTRLGDAHESGDTASVAMRVDPHEAPVFEQRFALVRDGTGAPWRIDAIEQVGVTPASAAAAFAAWPNEAARRALATGGAR